MASPSDVDEVRRNTNISSDDETWPFEIIDAYVDLVGITGATAKLWWEKAARYADLVDVSESGASERLGQLAAAARAAAKDWDIKYQAEITPISTTNARTFALDRESAS